MRILFLLLCAPALLAGEPARRRAVEHQSRVANVERVFLVILENTDATLAETLPFVTRLAARGALLRNDHCITHPSQPNYIAIVSGSPLGVTGSEPVTIDASHLGDLVERKGLGWKIYAENFPGGCYLGETFGTVADGQYVRRHVPFLSFLNVQQNIARCVTHVVNARSFDDDLVAGALPNLALYIPDNLHNGHDSNAFV
ncbi:MAG TPA: alkaline phosphatase family protein, partial [Burkholderiales bacterium]|nr:alkaline phosphatase family protein [Burkholderiales bacterium]